jgi:hypothetical protein
MSFWGGPIQGSDANHASAIEEALAAVQDCMARSPAPWPDAWRQEYLNTIREAISSDPNASQFLRRLEILRGGFALYWADLKNTPERSHFEVRRAQIRWYVENLMAAELPGEEETALLRHQYENLANHAAEGLLAQFSFLDPNEVRNAKAAYLADCYREIDAPLQPIFLTPLSQGQMEQINGRWHDLRYARVDLLHQLRATPQSPTENRSTPSGQTHPDHLLTRRSLKQLRSQIWVLVAPDTDYYLAAATKDLDAQKRRAQLMLRIRSREARQSMAVVQTEYLSFLVAALLETPACLSPGEIQKARQLNHEHSSLEGGDAYELKSASSLTPRWCISGCMGCQYLRVFLCLTRAMLLCYRRTIRWQQ